MVAHEWASEPQHQFMFARLSAYLAAVEDKTRVPLMRFWDQLWRDWFQLWPEELMLGLPLRVPGAMPLTPEELQRLGTSTTKRKEVSAMYL
jgi:hypothetical protein